MSSARVNDRRPLSSEGFTYRFSDKVVFCYKTGKCLGRPFATWPPLWMMDVFLNTALCFICFIQILMTNEKLHGRNAHGTHLVIFCSCMSVNQPFGNTTQCCVEETVSSENMLICTPGL